MQRRLGAVLALAFSFLAFFCYSQWIGSAGFASAQIDPSFTPFPTGDPRFVSIQGHLGSFPRSVTVKGNYAYLGIGSEFAILNITVPTSPIRVGYVLIPGYVGDIEIDGLYAYVSSWDAGLRIIDVSNPAAPMEVGFFGVNLDIRGLTVKDHFVYLASQPTGLHIVDVTNPEAPQEVGSLGCPCSLVDAVMKGDYVFSIDQGGSVRAIDVSDPKAPIEVNALRLPGYTAEDIQLNGNYLYIADWDQGLQIIDASNPLNLRVAGSFPISGVTNRVAISGNWAFLATEAAEGLYILNISNPVSPTLENTYEIQPFDISVLGGNAYVSDWNNALHVFDISKPSTPKDVGQYRVLSLPVAMDVKKEKAYIAEGFSGLDIVGVASPTFPEIVKSIDQGNKIKAIEVVTDTLYILGQGISSYGLYIFDLSNVVTPTLLSSYSIDGNDIEVVGNYAYVAGGQLNIIDISNPISPTLIGSTSGYFGSNQIAVVNDLALLTAGQSGVYVVDISKPYSPTLESVFHPSGYAMQVAAAGEFICVTWIDYSGSNYMGMTVLDISNPKAPEALGTYQFLGEPLDLTVVNRLAYIVSSENANLRIIDISDPLHLREIGYFSPVPPGYSGETQVIVNDGQIYLATSNGLFILRFYRDDVYLPYLLKTGNP